MYSWRDRFNADEWRDLLAMLINPQIVTGLERLIKDGYAGELLLYSLLQLFLEDDDLLRQFHSWLIILLEKHCPARSYTRQRWMQGLLKLLVELHKHVVLPKESQTQNDGCFQVTV